MILEGLAMRLLLALPLLAGCAPIADVLAPPYVPVPIHIYDQAQYEADKAECAAAGVAFVPQFSFGSALSQTVDGATSNTSLIPVSPLVPAYGAAGGAIRAASDGLDVMSGQHASVYRNCLSDELRNDKSAIVADPR
jgi:hypothetical protein